MFTWEEAGLLRIMLLVLKWAVILTIVAGLLVAAALLTGCPARGFARPTSLTLTTDFGVSI